MQKRYLGELAVGAIGLGCMGMSEFYGPTDESEAINVIHQAFAEGVTLFDTADVYGYGANEVLLGKAVHDFRDQVTIATKCGILRSPTDTMHRGSSAKPDYLKACCDASLKRLGTETIDLYYLHRMDPTTPIEDSMQAMVDLIKAGKIRHIGLSEAPVETIRRAHAVHPLTAIQSEYSLMTRTVEQNGVLDTCRQLNIGFVPYSPLGRGFIADQFTLDTTSGEDCRSDYFPRFQGKNLTQNQIWGEAVRQMAKDIGCSTAQLALAWVLAQGDFIAPIPGTKRNKYLLDNIGAINVTLSTKTLSQLETFSKKYPIQGERFLPEMMKAYHLEQ